MERQEELLRQAIGIAGGDDALFDVYAGARLGKASLALRIGMGDPVQHADTIAALYAH